MIVDESAMLTSLGRLFEKASFGASGLPSLLMSQTSGIGIGIGVKGLDGRYQLTNKTMQDAGRQKCRTDSADDRPRFVLTRNRRPARAVRPRDYRWRRGGEDRTGCCDQRHYPALLVAQVPRAGA